ncbi:MAG TPA: hypothetical protein VGK87_09920, partial [Anaerolineae bacterium]
MAITSAAILITMAVLWLVVSTDTALMNRKLHLYDDRQEQILQETNQLWTQLGQVTSAQEMDKRMHEAGFAPPQGLEFMVPRPVTATITSTLPTAGATR